MSDGILTQLQLYHSFTPPMWTQQPTRPTIITVISYDDFPTVINKSPAVFLPLDDQTDKFD